LVAALGRELAIEINGGTIALQSFVYCYVTLLALHTSLAIKKALRK
jgi:hypothetical protein